MCGKYTSSDLMLEIARAGARDDLARPQRRIGLQVFEIFEDLRGIEDLDRAVDQHRHLALGVDAQHFGMFGVVTLRRIVRHHDEVEVEPLLERRDLHLGAEHAERARSRW